MSHLATLIIQSFGMPPEIASIMGEFLELARYYIKTGIGVSTTNYTHTSENPVFGQGQGSVASMYVWGMIASKLITIHERHGFGALYSYPNGMNAGPHRDLLIAILSFVDDCNLSNTSAKHKEVKDILRQT